MIYEVSKIPDGGSTIEPKWAQEFLGLDPAGITQFTERRQITAPASVGITTGAFYGLYVDASSDSDAGDTFLQGGLVSGGNGGSATIPDYEVLSAGALPGGVSEGDVLYLRVACTATIEDGVMLPGVLVDGNAAHTKLLTGSSVPDPHVFTVDAEQGYLYTEIGRWTATEFLPAAPGNVLASGCIGNFNLSRI